MINTVDPCCRYSNLQKNGKSSNGAQRRRCNVCGKYFQREYRYNACKQDMHEKMTELTLSGSGVIDTGSVLKISKDTIDAALKKR